MSEETTVSTATHPSYQPLASHARTAFNWLLYSALAMTAVALLLLFVSFSSGAFEAALLGVAALIVAAPLFAGAGVVAGLGTRSQQ